MLRGLRRKLWGDLRANRGAFLAVWLTFTVGIVFYNATYPAGANFMMLLDNLNERTHLADLWFEMESAPAEVVDAVRAVDGVGAATGRLVYDVPLVIEGADALMTLRLISMPESDADVNNVVIQSGRAPSDEGEAALMESFAARHDIAPGDTLHLSGEDGATWDVGVAGLGASPEYLLASRSPLQPFPVLSVFGVAWMPYDALAARFDAAGTVNNVALTVEPGADLTAVRAAVTAVLEPYGISLIMDQQQQGSVATLNANANANTQAGLIFSLIFLFGSGAIMSVLMARQVDSERRLIGTMRAMGYTRREVLSYYLAFALVVAVTGVIVATPIGYLITYPVIDFFQRGMLGAAIPYFSNPPRLPFMLIGAAVGVVLALISAAVPAWRASATDPGLALRPPTPAGMGPLGRVNLPLLPRSGRQAFRNLLRVPGRTIGTVLGTVSGMAIIVIAFATWNEIDYNFNDLYKSHDYDFIVTTAQPVTHEMLLGQVEGIEGVTGVETALVMPVTVQREAGTYTAAGVALAEDQAFINFQRVEGAAALSGSSGAWLGHNLQRALGVEVGDELAVTVQGQTATVKVEGIIKQVIGAPMYVPASMVQDWTLGVRLANQAYIRADADHRLEVQRALAGLAGVVTVEDWPATTSDLQIVADFNGNFAYIFLGFGMFLTFIVLFNAINASMRERREELAIMRTQGVSMGEITRLVTWETMFATVTGLLLGAPVAVGLMKYITTMYDTDVAGNIFIIYPQTWLLAAAILVTVALISQVPPLRGVRAINLGDVSKSVNV
jgi:putative ABC transport system permease protein